MQESFRKLKLKELNRPSIESYKKAKKIPLTVVLDNIRSLHNIGAIFRTSDAFSIKEIWLIGITAKPPHREIQKTALGATETVNWKYFASSENAIEMLQKNKVVTICLEQSTNSCSPSSISIKPGEAYALILGNEVNGVSLEFMNIANQVMEIPQSGTKHSLNVSVATGIAIWELYKMLNR